MEDRVNYLPPPLWCTCCVRCIYVCICEVRYQSWVPTLPYYVAKADLEPVYRSGWLQAHKDSPASAPSPGFKTMLGSILLFETGSVTSLQLAHQTRLAGHQGLESACSSPQHQGYICTPHCAAFLKCMRWGSNSSLHI